MITSNLNYAGSDGRVYSTTIQFNQSSDFIEESDNLFPENRITDITEDDIIEIINLDDNIIEDDDEPIDCYDYIRERYNI